MMCVGGVLYSDRLGVCASIKHLSFPGSVVCCMCAVFTFMAHVRHYGQVVNLFPCILRAALYQCVNKFRIGTVYLVSKSLHRKVAHCPRLPLVQVTHQPCREERSR